MHSPDRQGIPDGPTQFRCGLPVQLDPGETAATDQRLVRPVTASHLPTPSSAHRTVMPSAHGLMVARLQGPVQKATSGSLCNSARSSTSFALIGVNLRRAVQAGSVAFAAPIPSFNSAETPTAHISIEVIWRAWQRWRSGSRRTLMRWSNARSGPATQAVNGEISIAGVRWSSQ
jgi:hypothetical protein